MHSLPETREHVNPVLISPDIEKEKDCAEVTLRFLVEGLTLDKQSRFIYHMDLNGFGLAQEGKYVALSPPKLAEPIRTATFVFSVHPMPGNFDNPDLAIADGLENALLVARAHGVRLLSASCPMLTGRRAS